MKKALLFGILAAGAAVATAIIYKSSKAKHYLCEDDYNDDNCDDCCCDCDADICDGDFCDIPAEKADDSCISGESSDGGNNVEASAKTDDTQNV